MVLLSVLSVGAEQPLMIVAEGTVERFFGEPPAPWQEVTKEALREAVFEAGRRLLMEERGDEATLETALGDRYLSFVIGYRVLGRWEFGGTRMVRLEVRVDRSSLRRYLMEAGVLRERARVVYLRVRGIEDYGDLLRVEEALKRGREVYRFSLWEASRGDFVWRLEMGEEGDLVQVLMDLPLEILRREEDRVEGVWSPAEGEEDEG